MKQSHPSQGVVQNGSLDKQDAMFEILPSAFIRSLPNNENCDFLTK